MTMISTLYTGFIKPYLANFEIKEGTVMFPSIDFLLAKTAITIVIICYAFFPVKMKSARQSSEFSKFLQETYNDLLVQRRTELLSKIKEERITEYLEKRKQKLGAREFEGINQRNKIC